MENNDIRIKQQPTIPSHIKMIMESIRSFANDGLYSVEEIERIIIIALEDGEINQDEMRVLRHVLEKARHLPFNEEVQPYIDTLSKLYLPRN
jgi:helix-turn-helix protein